MFIIRSTWIEREKILLWCHKIQEPKTLEHSLFILDSKFWNFLPLFLWNTILEPKIQETNVSTSVPQSLWTKILELSSFVLMPESSRTPKVQNSQPQLLHFIWNLKFLVSLLWCLKFPEILNYRLLTSLPWCHKTPDFSSLYLCSKVFEFQNSLPLFWWTKNPEPQIPEPFASFLTP